MRHWTICAAGALVLACFAAAPKASYTTNTGRQPNAASTVPTFSEVLESKVKAEWSAIKNKDQKAFSDLLTDEFIAVESDGEGARSRNAAVRELDAGLIYQYSLQRFKAVRLGPDAAFVTYESSITFPPKAPARFERVYAGEVWVKRDGQWKLLHYQETRVK